MTDNTMVVDGLRYELGLVKRAEIEVEDHGILTFWLHFDFHGSGQGFGGYCLDEYSKEEKRRIGHAAGTDAILGILRAVGVSKWSEVQGKLMWAIRDQAHGPIVGIARPRALGDGCWLISDWRKRWFPEAT